MSEEHTSEPLTPDVALPGQTVVDKLEPDVEREPAPDQSDAGDASDGAGQPDPAGTDPELGNTLIDPGNS